MAEKIFLARVAEQAERFDDMVEFLKQVIDAKDGDFTTEERNLLSVGFKNLIGVKRTAIAQSPPSSRTRSTPSTGRRSAPTKRRSKTSFSRSARALSTSSKTGA